MKSLVLIVHDVNPTLLPRDMRGSQVVRVQIDVQTGDPQNRFIRVWNLGEIEARVVELTPKIDMDSR